MAWLERGAFAAMLLAGLAHADAPEYGKVDTFQPGKKYNCVPTADRKAWDCNESGKTAAPQQAIPAEAAPAAAPATPPAAAPAPKSTALPSYLTNAAASNPSRAESAPAEPAPTAQRLEETAPAPAARQVPATPQPAAESESKQVATQPAAAPEQKPAAISEPAVQTQPVSAPPPDASPPMPAAPAGDENAVRGNREFLALPPASYVVEVAHGANRAELDALRANLHVHLGELYELHLTRDGSDWWLLVWGHFADIESARAARSDLPADAGWPRRIAPLQAEARKSGD